MLIDKIIKHLESKVERIVSLPSSGNSFVRVFYIKLKNDDTGYNMDKYIEDRFGVIDKKHRYVIIDWCKAHI